jgi:hypothetical protein
VARWSRVPFVLAALALAMLPAACGSAPLSSADYPGAVDEASVEARDKSEPFFIALGVVEDSTGSVTDAQELDRLIGPLAAWRAEVSLFVYALEQMTPPDEAAALHQELIAIQAEKRDALLDMEDAVDDEDLAAFRSAAERIDAADLRDDQWRSDAGAAGIALPFPERTSGSRASDSKKLRDQRRRAYEVAADNAVSDSAEAGGDSADALEGPLDEAVGPLEDEAAEDEAAADELDTLPPPEDVTEEHSDLADALRERADAASELADAADSGNPAAFQSAQAGYQQAVADQQAAASDLEDAGGFEFTVLTADKPPSKQDAEHGQHLPRAKEEKKD